MCSRTHAATQNLQLQLETLAKKGATALERFEAYTTEPTRAVFEMAEVTRALSALPAVTNQVLFLREQIEMRSLGVGWSDHLHDHPAELVKRRQQCVADGPESKK